MSDAVRQFLELVNVQFVEIETVKMLNQGREWCVRCHAWTFPARCNQCSCGLCWGRYDHE